MQCRFCTSSKTTAVSSFFRALFSGVGLYIISVAVVEVALSIIVKIKKVTGSNNISEHCSHLLGAAWIPAMCIVNDIEMSCCYAFERETNRQNTLHFTILQSKRGGELRISFAKH